MEIINSEYFFCSFFLFHDPYIKDKNHVKVKRSVYLESLHELLQTRVSLSVLSQVSAEIAPDLSSGIAFGPQQGQFETQLRTEWGQRETGRGALGGRERLRNKNIFNYFLLMLNVFTI